MNQNTKNVMTVSALLLLLVGPCFAVVPNYVVKNMELEAASFFQMMSMVAAFGVILIVNWAIIRSQKIDIRSIGFGAPSPGWVIVMAAIIGIFWAISSTASLRGIDPEADVVAIWTTFSFTRVVLVVFGATFACVEDFITRGFVMSQLKERGVPTWVQLLFSSFLFAAYHSLWAIPYMGVYFLYGLFGSLVYGLLLGGIYLLGKRSLTPVMISHGLTVVLGEPILSYVLMKPYTL